jgi:hypothetical protein
VPVTIAQRDVTVPLHLGDQVQPPLLGLGEALAVLLGGVGLVVSGDQPIRSPIVPSQPEYQ